MTPSEHIGIAASAPRLDTLPAAGARVRQNWVLDPIQDVLFIIAAPLISLGVALWLMQRHGAAEGAAMIILAHVVLTVAHHMPTFIRIYGDVELFQRFKWSFVLGPLIPLAFSAVVLVYLNARQLPVEYFLYLYIFLTLWDPWHFLRQHFGFMRIYDRHNRASPRLASNMDWAISGLWFVFIMASSSDWLPDLLADLYRNAHIPLLLLFSADFMQMLKMVTGVLAAAMTAVYVGYLVWCAQRGYYVSPAKVALLLCTFGVMYLTYTPNDWILQLAPAWGFKVGFATVGIVHMTQYLAIVWRFDQRIAQQGRARSGWFAWLHNRRTVWGIALAALVYVAFCIEYGNVITTEHDNRLIMSVLLAVGFTSTLLHYYFDGFIWKVRHQQNRTALDLATPMTATTQLSASGDNATGSAGQSWWQGAVRIDALHMLGRQLLYFGLPMGLLTIGALSVWRTDQVNYVQYMYQAQQFSAQGNGLSAADAARKAYTQMQRQLPIMRKLAELKPTSAHQAELAFLIYNESLYQNIIMPQLGGQTITAAQQAEHRARVREAAQWLLSADYLGGDLAHPGHEQLTHEQARSIALSWQRQVG